MKISPLEECWLLANGAAKTLVPLAFEHPELLEGEFATVFGKLGTEKLVEYATALSFNAPDTKGDTLSTYPINWATDHNQDQIQLPNGKWISKQAYVQQQLSQGNSMPLSVTDMGTRYRCFAAYILPDEVNLNRDPDNISYCLG